MEWPRKKNQGGGALRKLPYSLSGQPERRGIQTRAEVGGKRDYSRTRGGIPLAVQYLDGTRPGRWWASWGEVTTKESETVMIVLNEGRTGQLNLMGGGTL